MRKKRTILLACVMTAALVAAVALALVWLHNWPVENFNVVQEGVLYRGGQPSGKALEHIFEHYRVKTVVNLRDRCPEEEWWQAERDTCRQRGVRMVDVPIDEDANAAASGLKQFLALATDNANHPILVHCEAGSARTGYAVAAYRIVVQRWTYSQAVSEAKENGFDPRVHLNVEYDRILRWLADGADWQRLGRPDASSPGT